MRADEPARSIVAADQALDLAEHLGLERLVAETFNNKGSSLGFLGRRREGTALLRAAVDLAHAGGFVAAELRAMNNLATGLDTVSEARVLYLSAEELGARVGNRSMTSWARESRRFSDFLAAEDWDAAMVGADDVDIGAESALDELRRLWNTLNILIARGQPIDAPMARLETLSDQVSDPFALAALHALRADRALLAREFDAAVDEAFAAAAEMLSFAPANLVAAIRAAVRGGDVVRAREALERIEQDPSTGVLLDAGRAAARAGVAELEGRSDDAVSDYRDAVARFRSIGFNILAGRSALDLVTLVGGTHPAGFEAAAEARTIFERVGAKPYLDLLDAAEAGPGIAARAAAIPDVTAPRGART
jgi:hypothetical protein